MKLPKRVLITGITGSGGSYLSEYIARFFPEIIIYGFHRGNCNLNNSVLLRQKLWEVDPDIIFHLASDADVKASFDNPKDVLRNNIIGTCNLFETIRDLKIDPIIQHCSTSEVYGQVTKDDIPITEDCPIRPVSPYAISKTAQDFLAQTYFKSYGMRIVITRMFAYINPRRTNLFASSFALQIARIEVGLQKELTHGNLNSVRTLIDVRDAMEAYWMAAMHCEPGEVYNIGGGEPITVGEFLDLLISKSKCKIKKRLDKALLRPVDVTLQIADSSKFKTATGWEPKISYEESVDWLLAESRRRIHESVDING